MPRCDAIKPRVGGERTAREYMVPHRAARPERRGDPRREHPLPRRGGGPLRLEVGHRLRRDRPRPGAGEGRQGDRAPPRRLAALAGDRRRNGLLHAEPAARRDDLGGDLQRHLAGYARGAARQRRAPRPGGSHRAGRRRATPVPRRELRPRARPRRAPPHPRPRARVRRVLARARTRRHGPVRRRALALRRSSGARAQARSRRACPAVAPCARRSARHLARR